MKIKTSFFLFIVVLFVDLPVYARSGIIYGDRKPALTARARVAEKESATASGWIHAYEF